MTTRRALAWCCSLALLGCIGKRGSSGAPNDRSDADLGASRARARLLAGEPAQHLPAVVDGNSRFALDLYAALRSEKGNLFFSPFSLSTALAMTYAGAGGETAAEMAEVLHLPADQAQLHAVFGALVDGLERGAGAGGYRLEIANRLWGQGGYPFREAFLATCREHYGAGFETFDFRADPESGRRTINAWVEEQTRQKIRDLLPTGSITALTRLVLTNAVYFKGDWSSPFDPDDTRDAPFHLAGGKTVEAPLMYQSDRFRFAAHDGFKILELPYADKALSMLVLLPDRVDGLAALEDQLGPERLASWIGSLGPAEVEVYLPRFELTDEFSLAAVLQAMGMRTAFNEPRPGDPAGADFTRMAEPRELFIGGVFHKGYVKVNEEGTEAAAATGVVMVTSVPVQQVVFRADHPFLFLLRDNETGSLLFIGRLEDPKA